jgi:tetratricopeptide (TPR) repeat protein
VSQDGPSAEAPGSGRWRFPALAFVATGTLMAVAHATPPGPFLVFLAFVALAVPLGCAFLLEPLPRAALLVVTMVGFRLAFAHLVAYEPFSFVGLLAIEVAYYAVPPFLLSLVVVLLGPRISETLGLAPVHVYLPLLVAVPVVAGTLIYQRATGAETVGASLRLVGIIYGLGYIAIFALVFATRNPSPESTGMAPGASNKAGDMESTGRFGVAARYYARDGNFAKAAEMAERSGEWEKAAELNKRVGNFTAAAEMYSRAERWEEAVDAYTRVGNHAAAALVCERLGWTDRAAAAFEKCGDVKNAIRVLEAGGRQPSAELYEKAGLPAKAAAVYLARGSWQRAVEILERQVGDVEGAARICLDSGGYVEAGRLFERAKRPDDAVAAYLKSPSAAFEALRLCLERDDLEQARRIAESRPAEAEAKAMEDEKTAIILARLHHQAGRIDDAVRLLQRLKRGAAVGGGVSLMLGRCFRDKGLPELAEQELALAVTMPLGPREDMEARYELARVLETLGHPDRALEIYRELMKQQFDYRDVEQRYRVLSTPPTPA